jgi:hypothetical protein
MPIGTVHMAMSNTTLGLLPRADSHADEIQIVMTMTGRVCRCEYRQGV